MVLFYLDLKIKNVLFLLIFVRNMNLEQVRVSCTLIAYM